MRHFWSAAIAIVVLVGGCAFETDEAVKDSEAWEQAAQEWMDRHHSTARDDAPDNSTVESPDELPTFQWEPDSAAICSAAGKGCNPEGWACCEGAPSCSTRPGFPSTHGCCYWVLTASTSDEWWRTFCSMVPCTPGEDCPSTYDQGCGHDPPCP